ncbi:6274_t:CDS:2 [Entrophospora sp. SA101]|nr:6274_t:CDS:2 [Entrophospora sp. SA101]CAJ0912192.1 4614_t:CDS:2 [Entrophospora sp. SA101]
MPKAKRNDYGMIKFSLNNRSGRGGSHYNNRPPTTTNNKDNNLNVIFSLNEGEIDDDKLLENPPCKIHFSSIEELISPSTKSRSYNKSQKDPTGKIHIPRPQNAFVLFRKNHSEGLKNRKKSDRTAGKISTSAKEEWDNVSSQELISPSTKSRSYNKSQKDPTGKIHIPRPQNAFVLFRKNHSEGLKNRKKSDRTAGKISTSAKEEWDNVSSQTYQLYQQFYEILYLEQFQNPNMNQDFDQPQQYQQLPYAQLQYMPDVMITSPEECLIPNSAVESSPTSTSFSELESPEIEYYQYSNIHDSPLFPEIELSRSVFDNDESKY